MASGILELSINYRYLDVDCIVTHAFFKSGYTAPDDLPALAADWQGDPQTAFRATQTDFTTLRQITVSQLATDGGLNPAPYISPINAAGTRGAPGGDMLPPYVCQVFTIRTLEGGRRRRGRNFWSGAGEYDVAHDGWQESGAPAYFKDKVVDYYSALNDVFGPLGSSAFRWSVFSRKQYAVGGFSDSAASVSSWQAQPLVHTLRSRRI